MATASSPKHILALNDAPELLALYTELLEEAGYRVSTQQHVSRDIAAIVALAPDLIILDYIWGTEDAGWLLLEQLKLEPSTAEISVVLCTGATEQLEPIKPMLDEMGVPVVHKPFDIDHLLKVIATALQDAEPVPRAGTQAAK